MMTFFPCPEVPPLGPFPVTSPLLDASWRPIEPRVLPIEEGSGTAVARSGRDDIVALFNIRRLRGMEPGEDSDK